MKNKGLVSGEDRGEAARDKKIRTSLHLQLSSLLPSQRLLHTTC